MKARIKSSLRKVLFGEKESKKNERVYKVETLNAKRGIVTTMRKTVGKPEYVVCLCLTPKKVITTKLHSRVLAEELISSYVSLYKGFDD